MKNKIVTIIGVVILFFSAAIFTILAIDTTSRNLADADDWREPVATEATFRAEISDLLKEEGGDFWTLRNLEDSLTSMGVRYRTPAEWRRDVMIDSALTYGEPTFWVGTEAKAWVREVRRELSALGIQRIHGWKVSEYRDGG